MERFPSTVGASAPSAGAGCGGAGRARLDRPDCHRRPARRASSAAGSRAGSSLALPAASALPPQDVRDWASLQCCAPSTSDQSRPPLPRPPLAPSNRAPIPNKIAPQLHPFAPASPHGNGSSSGSQPSSSSRARGRARRAAEAAGRSPGVVARLASPPASSSSRSRHHAMRIAPTAGHCSCAPHRANARSRFRTMQRMRASSRGICSSATAVGVEPRAQR